MYWLTGQPKAPLWGKLAVWAYQIPSRTFVKKSLRDTPSRGPAGIHSVAMVEPQKLPRKSLLHTPLKCMERYFLRPGWPSQLELQQAYALQFSAEPQ